MRYSDAVLRQALQDAKRRYRLASMLHHEFKERTSVSVEDFIARSVALSEEGIGMSDLVTIGDCFGLNSHAIKTTALGMTARGLIQMDNGWRFRAPT